MKKKNQKKSPQQLKLEQAHQKNLYLSKIKTMMGIIGSASAYDLISNVDIEMLYQCRLRPVKLKSSDNPEQVLPNLVLKALNDNLHELIRKIPISLGEGREHISLYDFYTYVESIYLYWRNADKPGFKNGKEFKELFPIFKNDFMKIRVEVLEKLQEMMYMLSWQINDIIYRLVWFESEKPKPGASPLDLSIFMNNYIIHMEEPESEIMDIDGNKRSIFRIGITKLEGVTWLSLTPEFLGMNGILNKLQLKVFIQIHAIERLQERLGPFLKHLDYIIIVNAIVSEKPILSDDGNFLFAVMYLSHKLGYLKADVIGDKLVIRTFLFITNNGTPEGKQLSELLGIVKEDKKYLGIDKLSTFINSDIDRNETLKDIFCKAGCGGLFEVKKYLAKESDKTVNCADYLIKYLGLEKEKEMSNQNKLLAAISDFSD